MRILKFVIIAFISLILFVGCSVLGDGKAIVVDKREEKSYPLLPMVAISPTNLSLALSCEDLDYVVTVKQETTTESFYVEKEFYDSVKKGEQVVIEKGELKR